MITNSRNLYKFDENTSIYPLFPDNNIEYLENWELLLNKWEKFPHYYFIETLIPDLVIKSKNCYFFVNRLLLCKNCPLLVDFFSGKLKDFVCNQIQFKGTNDDAVFINSNINHIFIKNLRYKILELIEFNDFSVSLFVYYLEHLCLPIYLIGVWVKTTVQNNNFLCKQW